MFHFGKIIDALFAPSQIELLHFHLHKLHDHIIKRSQGMIHKWQNEIIHFKII